MLLVQILPETWRQSAIAESLRRLLRGRRHPFHLRETLARHYLRGSGLEIGALHHPLRLPRSLQVTYVDRFDNSELLRHYPDLNPRKLVPVGIVDDGESLTRVADESQDFIIANHFLEHTQNPLGVLERFADVLRPGGRLFLTVPDKTGNFDRDRPLTQFDHLLRDYRDGPAWSYRGHVEEFVRLVQKLPEDQVAAQIANIIQSDYSIHFHVWDHQSLLMMLSQTRQAIGIPLQIEAYVKNEQLSESICILRKR